MNQVNEQLIAMLSQAGARFTVVGHPSAGKSDEVAKVRGTKNSQGAKAMVCVARHSEGPPTYILAILPGDRKLDFSLLARSVGAKKVSIAEREVASAMTGCEIGAIPPFSFAPELDLIVDPLLIDLHTEIAFNAGRLDQSIILDSADYVRIARPRLLPISKET